MNETPVTHADELLQMFYKMLQVQTSGKHYNHTSSSMQPWKKVENFKKSFMKKVLGASLGVLAITFMSFASPQQGNIKANDAQVVSAQTDRFKDAATKTVVTTVKTTVNTKTISTEIKTVITTSKAKSAQLNDVMKKYLNN